MSMDTLASSKDHTWETPDELLELVRKVSPTGRIGLDPASCDGNPTGAEVYYTPTNDGLSLPWAGFGLVYLNPPYGREIPYWIAKATGEHSTGAEIVALLPARTDTGWFNLVSSLADELCFLRGRLTFKGATAPAPFPSVVAYWGDRAKVFRRVFASEGWMR